MTDRLSGVLNALVPAFDEERGDWAAVARDAGVSPGAHPRTEAPADSLSGTSIARRRQSRRVAPRRLVFAALALAASVVSLAAVATAQNWWARDWWFFRFGGSPAPVTEVRIVKTGTWDGTAWQLVAYVSSTDGICFGITPADTARTSGEGAALACDRIEGVRSTPDSKPSTPHAVTFMAASSGRLPPHIVGPVIDAAHEVEIHLWDGEVVRTATFEAPDEFGSVRFYATQVPDVAIPRPRRDEPPHPAIRKLVGFDESGQIVACLTLPMPEKGVPLSACR